MLPRKVQPSGTTMHELIVLRRDATRKERPKQRMNSQPFRAPAETDVAQLSALLN
jgi:hypothetical protein